MLGLSNASKKFAASGACSALSVISSVSQPAQDFYSTLQNRIFSRVGDTKMAVSARKHLSWDYQYLLLDCFADEFISLVPWSSGENIERTAWFTDLEYF